MRRLFLLFVSMVLSGSAFSQKIGDTALFRPYYVIKYTPTSLLNPIYPAIHFAAEYQVAVQKGYQLEAGYILPHHLLDKSANGFGDFDSENKGFFLKLEYRKYCARYRNIYWAVQLQYIYNYYKRTDTFDATPQSTAPNTFCSTCVEDTYYIRKKAFGVNVKIGMQPYVSDRIVVDLYLGLGINYLNNDHMTNELLHYHPAMADSPVGYYLAHFPGSYVFPLPTFASGLRIGYRVDKKKTSK